MQILKALSATSLFLTLSCLSFSALGQTPDAAKASDSVDPQGSNYEYQCGYSEIVFEVPYSWSKSPSPEERFHIKRTLETAAQLAFTRAGDPQWQQADSDLRIRGVRITGYSSPESLNIPDSLLPDSIQAANVRAGFRRALAIQPALIELFNDQGMHTRFIESKGQERQFTEAQWQSLHNQATGNEALHGDYDLQAIFALVTTYVRDRASLSDEQRQAVANTLADKKTVEITLCYESSAPVQYVVQAAEPETKVAPEAPAENAPNTENSTSTDDANKINPIIREAQKQADQAEIEATQEADQTQVDPVSRGTSEELNTLKTALKDYGLYIGIAVLAVLLVIGYLIWLSRRLTRMRLEAEALPRRNRKAWNAPHSRLVAIMSGKGGTGKSSISSSLAFSLAHTGYRTLLVDVDLFTHGLTFLNEDRLGSREDIRPLKDLFDHAPDHAEPVEPEDKNQLPTPLPVQTKFTGSNLYLLPSVNVELEEQASQVAGHEPLELPAPYNELKPFAKRLRESLERLGEIHDFDYIVLDTRGGADHTSVGAALAAGTFLLVTESDKPSWAISDRLLDTVHAVREESGMHSQSLGFVINKNALPTDKIEPHLKERWHMEHLGTLPYDVNVVRCFEQAEIPVEKKGSSPFSESMFDLVRRLHKAAGWEVAETLRAKRSQPVE